jgi:cation transport regulator ChaB
MNNRRCSAAELPVIHHVAASAAKNDYIKSKNYLYVKSLK